MVEVPTADRSESNIVGDRLRKTWFVDEVFHERVGVWIEEKKRR